MCELNVLSVTDETVFCGLEKEWNALARQTDPSSVFLRHEWFDAVWQWLKQDCQMLVLVVKQGSALVGICPFVIRTATSRGFRVSSVEFMSVPDTQYCNFLAVPELRSRVIETAADFLLGSHVKWDRLVLAKLAPDSEIIQKLKITANKHRLSFCLVDDGVNPGLSLQQTWQEYYSRRSRRMKKGNNHAANRLAKTGMQVNLQQIVPAVGDKDAIENLLRIVTAVSAGSWKKITKLTLDNPGPSAFIRRLSQHAQRQGWLSLWLLRFDNTVVAMEYQIVYEGIVAALRADFSTEYESLSPGTYMNWKMLEQMFKNDYIYYCMGPGENTYKLRWAENLPHLSRVDLYNNTGFARMIGYMECRLVPFARRLAGICRTSVNRQSADK